MLFQQPRREGWGRRRAMLGRWEKDVLLTWVMCDLKEREGSMMVPRCRARGDEVTE